MTKASIPTAAQQNENTKVLEEIHKLSRLDTTAKKQEIIKDLVKYLRDKNLPSDERYVVLMTLISLIKQTDDFGSCWTRSMRWSGHLRSMLEKKSSDCWSIFWSPANQKDAFVLRLKKIGMPTPAPLLNAAEAAVRRPPGSNSLIKAVTETLDAITAREKDWKAFQAASMKLADNARTVTQL